MLITMAEVSAACVCGCEGVCTCKSSCARAKARVRDIIGSIACVRCDMCLCATTRVSEKVGVIIYGFFSWIFH